MAIVARGLSALCHLAWPSLSAGELDARFEGFLETVAAPGLGLKRGDYEAPEPAATGRNTVVRRWVTKQGVLYARGWRYDLLTRQAHEQAFAGGLLTAAGLRVPELLWRDASFATLRRHRLEATIERAAPGQPVLVRTEIAAGVQLPAEMRSAVARELHRLHVRRNAAWGKPWRPVNEMKEPRAYWLGRLALWRKVVPAAALSLPAERITSTLNQLSERIAQFDFGVPRLVHGDLSPAHLFWDGSGQLTWIDFGTVHYGHPAQDLAMARQWVARGQEHAEKGFADFLDEYLAEEKTDRAALEAGIAFFAELKLWDKLSSRIAKRANHAQNAGRLPRLTQEQEKIERQLREQYLL